MTDVIMSFKTSEEMRDQIKELAAKRDMSASQIIRGALKKYIQEVDRNVQQSKSGLCDN